MFMPLIFASGIVVGRYYYDYKKTNTRSEYREEKSLFLNEVDVAAQWVMAVGTIALFGWTLWATRKSNELATEALKASTAATSAYLEVERARIVFDRFDWYTTGKAFDVHFVNMGGAGIVRGFTIDFNPVNGDPMPYFPIGGINSYIGSGDDFIAGYAEKSPLFLAVPVPDFMTKQVVSREEHSVIITILYADNTNTFHEERYHISLIPSGGGGFISMVVSHIHLPMSQAMSNKLLYEMAVDAP